MFYKNFNIAQESIDVRVDDFFTRFFFVFRICSFDNSASGGHH